MWPSQKELRGGKSAPSQFTRFYLCRSLVHLRPLRGSTIDQVDEAESLRRHQHPTLVCNFVIRLNGHTAETRHHIVAGIHCDSIELSSSLRGKLIAEQHTATEHLTDFAGQFRCHIANQVCILEFSILEKVVVH